MARSPRPRSSSAATTWSRPRISTRRPSWRPASQGPASAASRFARSWRCRPTTPAPRPEPMRPPGDMLGSGRAMDSERETIGGVFREERARMLATLIRLLGDIDRADEGLASALEAALVQWPTEGTPGNPRAWLIRTARNKAVDSLRRGALFEEKRAELKMEASSSSAAALDIDEEPVDDRLRLIFTLS